MNARTFAKSTKWRIIQAVHQNPGQTGREIAQSLGLDKKRVNQFLYGEGQKKWGVIVRNWRWYPVASVTPSPELTPLIPPDTICGALISLPITSAILKIRGMTLEQVNLCFEEDEFSLLDDSLKAELSIRKKTLESLSVAVVHQQKAGSGRWFWLAVVVIAVWIASLLGSRQSSDDRQPQQGGHMENVLPNR